MIEPRKFAIRKADVLISTESNTGSIVMVKCGLLLRGQRALHALHCDYPVNWGEPDVSCDASMANNCKTENVKRASGSRIAS